MKNLLFAIMLLFTTTASSKNDVTKFLGIPVDGTKNAMIDKLIDKGFTYNREEDYLEGEFNGRSANVYIATHKKKVFRIMVAFNHLFNEADIKLQFNLLCQQFKDNDRYLPYINQPEIPDSVDISYEMIVKNKRFDAAFFQDVNYALIDTSKCKKMAIETLSKSYSQEELNNPTKELNEEIEDLFETIYLTNVFKIAKNKNVWFMITYYKGRDQYGITMYYDNGYNQANGEDL